MSSSLALASRSRREAHDEAMLGSRTSASACVQRLVRWSCVVALATLGISASFLLFCAHLNAQTTVHPSPDHPPLDSVGTVLVDRLRLRLNAITRGDSATYVSLVDPDFVLIAGDADVDTRTSEASWMAARVRSTPLVRLSFDVKDIEVHRFGDVAILTYVQRADSRYGNQIVHATTRGSSTCVHRQSGWVLVASQHTFLPTDPAVVASNSRSYGVYVGVYDWGGGVTDTVSREGTRLFSRVSDDPKKYELLPEGPDRFSPKGYSIESVTFTRNSAGRITGYVSRGGGNAVAVARKVK